MGKDCYPPFLQIHEHKTYMFADNGEELNKIEKMVSNDEDVIKAIITIQEKCLGAPISPFRKLLESVQQKRKRR